MRRHKYLVWGVVLLLVASGLVAVLLWPWPDRPVSLARCERVRVGMTLEEVEAVLGGPPGDYHTGDVEVYPPQIDLDLHGVVRNEAWQGNEGTLWVGFDTKDRVVACKLTPGRRLTVIDKLRAWLGF